MAPRLRARKPLTDRPNPPPTPPIDESSHFPNLPEPPQDQDLPSFKPSISESSFTTNEARSCLATPGSGNPFLPGEALYDTIPSSSPIGEDLRSGSRKVDFSAWTKYHQHPGSQKSWFMSPQPNLRPLPSSTDRPQRSILKNRNMGSPQVEAEDPFTSMRPLFSFLVEKLCNSEDSAATVDGYMKLISYIKDLQDTIQDPEFLQSLEQIEVKITDDIGLSDKDDGKPPITNISHAALRLVSTLVGSPQIWPSLQQRFCEDMLWEFRRILDEPKSSKLSINLAVHFVTQQNFSRDLMDENEVRDICHALEKVHERITGNTIVGERLTAYRKLVQQNPQAMADNIGKWTNPLFSGMFSSIKAIRERAIGLGLDAGQKCGIVPKVTQCIVELMDGQLGGAVTIDYFSKRLTTMITSTNNTEASHAPQIWTVVVLLLRGKPRQLDGWRHLKTWLTILQKAFNSTNRAVRSNAYTAWAKYIHALHPAARKAMIRQLKAPSASGLSRLQAVPSQDDARQTVQSSICTLLFLQFRQTGDEEQYSLMWEELISNGIRRWSMDDDAIPAARMLGNLLAKVTPSERWTEEKFQKNELMTPSHLPVISPSWVRREILKVIEDVEPIIGRLILLDRPDTNSTAIDLLKCLVSSVGAVNSREIQLSREAALANTAIWKMILYLPYRFAFVGQIRDYARRMVNIATYVQFYAVTIAGLGIKSFIRGNSPTWTEPSADDPEEPTTYDNLFDFKRPLHMLLAAVTRIRFMHWPETTVDGVLLVDTYIELMIEILKTAVTIAPASEESLLIEAARRLRKARDFRPDEINHLQISQSLSVLASSPAIGDKILDILYESPQQRIVHPPIDRAEIEQADAEVAEEYHSDPEVEIPLESVAGDELQVATGSDPVPDVEEFQGDAEADVWSSPSSSEANTPPEEEGGSSKVASTFFPNLVPFGENTAPLSPNRLHQQAPLTGTPEPSSDTGLSGYQGSSPTPGSRSVDVARAVAEHRRTVQFRQENEPEIPSSPPAGEVDPQAPIGSPGGSFDAETYERNSAFSSSPIPPRQQPLASSEIANPSDESEEEGLDSEATIPERTAADADAESSEDGIVVTALVEAADDPLVDSPSPPLSDSYYDAREEASMLVNGEAVEVEVDASGESSPALRSSRKRKSAGGEEGRMAKRSRAEERNRLEKATDEFVAHRRADVMQSQEETEAGDAFAEAREYLLAARDLFAGGLVPDAGQLRELDDLMFEIKCHAHAAFNAAALEE